MRNFVLASAMVLALAVPARADDVPEKYRPVVQKGLEWLVKQQHKDGHWSAQGDQYSVAMTAFAGMALSVFAILLWKENMDLNRDYAALNDEMQMTRKHLQEASHLLAELSSPNTVNATLVSANQKPQPQCRIIYLRKTGTLVIAANNLPALPGNKVFELWIIPADGSAPVPGAPKFTPN